MKKLNAYEVMGLLKAKQIEKQLQKQKGATMVEYAIVIAGVAIVGALLFGGVGGGKIGEKITDFIGDITLEPRAGE